MNGDVIRRAILASYDRELRTICASERRAELIEAREAVAFAPTKFFSDVAEATGLSLASIVDLFRNPMVVRLFKAVGWSFKKLYGMLKSGYRAYKDLLGAIAEYVSSTRVSRWTEEELRKLDAFLKEHPKTRRIAGAATAALLVYMWFLMAFTGDFEWDFDLSDVLGALGGNFTLSALFAGKEGSKLLLAFAIGATLRASFPWPGPTTIHFIGSIIYTLAKRVRARLRRKKESAARRILRIARQILAE